MRKRSGVCVALMFVSGSLFSQALELRNETSTIRFYVKNFGLTVDGSIKGLTGNFILDEDSVERSSFLAIVRPETIETDVALRDKHLRGENYFDVKNYPLIRISSKKNNETK